MIWHLAAGEGKPETACGKDYLDLPDSRVEQVTADLAKVTCRGCWPEPIVLVNEEWLTRQPVHRYAGEKTACGLHPRWQVLVTTKEAVLVTCQECKRK